MTLSIQNSQANAAHIIKKRHPNFIPKVGLILGSGLNSLADHIQDAHFIPYAELPGFSEATVVGHVGRLVLGYLNNVPVVCLQGRPHYYEGIANKEIQVLIRTLKLLGCEILLATNAAGSLNLAAAPGSLMLITDHINFQFNNPLVGYNHDEFGPRFVNMENAYDRKLRALMRTTATEHDIELHQGIYLGVLGPSFETPAEIRAFKLLGADAVGMSTIAEVIVARHCGLRVVAISAITNYAAGLNENELNHEETLHYGNKASKGLLTLTENFIARLKDE